MRAALMIFTALILSVIAGCKPGAGEKELLSGEKQLLTVDFQEGQTLQYKFVSSRDTEIEVSSPKKGSKSSKKTTSKSTESMQMVVTYTPVKVDPYGLTTIKATCESVKVTRSKRSDRRAGKKDAVENLAGRSFTFTVGPTGKIEDYSQLDKLIKEIGQKAFRPGDDKVKEPDMIGDFIVGQWFLWDSISSIKKPAKGVSTGQTWMSKLSVPAPMVLRKARDVTYSLDEIRQSEQGQLAVISSSYSLAESVPKDWPVPYSGRFEVSGPFGFYINYQVLDLKGKGQELFNIEKGRIEQYNQQYRMQLKASLRLPLPSVYPVITVNQKLTMQLLE